MAWLSPLWQRPWAWLGVIAQDPRKRLIVDLLNAAGLIALAIVFTLYAIHTRDAICNLRSDLEHRVDSTQAFLDAHPDLKVIRFGEVVVTRGQLVAQLASQKATLRSLDGLNC